VCARVRACMCMSVCVRMCAFPRASTVAEHASCVERAPTTQNRSEEESFSNQKERRARGSSSASEQTVSQQTPLKHEHGRQRGAHLAAAPL